MIRLWTAEVFPPLHFDPASNRALPDRAGDRRASARFGIHSKVLTSIGHDLDQCYRKAGLAGAECVVYASFEEAPLPWFATGSTPDGWVSSATIAVPRRVGEVESITQLSAILRRFVRSALEELHHVDLAALPLDAEVRVPLATLRALPACGPKRGKWSRNPDVDAFAKAARVIADLAEESLPELGLTGWWPTLDVLPVITRQPDTTPSLSDAARLYSVPVEPGFHSLDPMVRGEFVLGAFMDGLKAVGAALGEDWAWAISRMAATVRRAGFVCSAISEPFQSPDGATYYAEYRADLDGPAARLHARKADVDRAGEWHRVGCGVAPFRFLTPLQDIQATGSNVRWRLPGWTRWLSEDPLAWAPAEV